jgi:hypothetical protein
MTVARRRVVLFGVDSGEWRKIQKPKKCFIFVLFLIYLNSLHHPFKILLCMYGSIAQNINMAANSIFDKFAIEEGDIVVILSEHDDPHSVMLPHLLNERGNPVYVLVFRATTDFRFILEGHIFTNEEREIANPLHADGLTSLLAIGDRDILGVFQDEYEYLLTPPELSEENIAEIEYNYRMMNPLD